MTILKYLRLPFLFDASLLQKDVANLSSANWLLHYQKMHYEGKWSAIPLRSIGGKADSIIISPEENPVYNDTIFLKECSYISSLLANFKCTLQAVRLLKLNAGATIKEHKDNDLCFEKGEVRFHIPVRTHSDVHFFLDKEEMNLQEGECWYMNFNLLHSIHNKSNIDRVHLVIDAEVNDWVKDIFANTPATKKKEIEDTTGQVSREVKQAMIFQFRQMNTATTNMMADNLEKEMQHAELKF
jgi:Aspartyl/Asparaginyl beta-hydroxylase